ncbi:putative cyclin-dependent kinase F-2 [Triticum urartu]|uniref:putative cyclin-dependent kinase F-2 n=1 Tax=Triticum urartu TaxID=4572 RepID=UPI002042BFF3|nr:putative cyclin-dependent kinase F-2 [Triticum urartu]
MGWSEVIGNDVATATPAVRNRVDRRDEWGQRATATGGDSSKSAIGSRFERLGKIGEGGFGVVYRARDRRTGEIVAIKCLRTNKYGNDDRGDRYLSVFAGEVSALEKCSGHPSIVQLRASGQHNGEAFIAMEFVGQTLRYVMKHVRFGRRHTEMEVCLMMRQLLTGVGRMNRLGLKHRDLKPGNVLVDDRRNLKICDLGLSCNMTDGPPYSNHIGTRGYRAPELLLGSTNYDERIDSWALVVMMAELLAGHHPFYGKTDMDHLSAILDLLGTADIKEWPGYDGRQLPGGWALHSSLRSMFPSPADARRRCRPQLSEAGFEVLSGLLRCNPEKRLMARGALRHRWFKETNFRAAKS